MKPSKKVQPANSALKQYGSENVAKKVAGSVFQKMKKK